MHKIPGGIINRITRRHRIYETQSTEHHRSIIQCERDVRDTRLNGLSQNKSDAMQRECDLHPRDNEISYC